MFTWLKKIQSSSAHVSGIDVTANMDEPKLPSYLIVECTALKNLGDQAFDDGLLEDAKKLYQKAISLNPMFAEAYNNLGNVFKEQGFADEAEHCLKQAIMIKPELANANFGLGTLLLERGRGNEAIEFLSKALELKPDIEFMYSQLGNALFHTGKIELAKQVIEKGIAFNPLFADFHFFLGNIYLYEKNTEQAVVCYHQALSSQPMNVEVLSNLGKALLSQGKLEDALSYSRKVLELNPNMIDLHISLAHTFLQQKNLNAAVACYTKVVTCKQDVAEAHYYLGNALYEQGNLNEAISCYQMAISLKPDFAYPYLIMGNLHKLQGRPDEAMACYKNALAHKPDLAGALSNIGVLLQEQEDWEESINYYQKALALNSELTDARCNLGTALVRIEKRDEAISSFRQVLELNPEHHSAHVNLLRELQQICVWHDWEQGIRSLKNAVSSINATTQSRIDPFVFISLPGTTAAEHKNCAEKLVLNVFNPILSIRNKLAFNHNRSRCKKVNIGYLSGDFRLHPISFLIAEVIERHDRSRFNITAYSFGADDYSETRQRLENAFDIFTNIENKSYEDAARRIYDDRIDILVDLTGYTHNSRSAILALRPAPIQVNYLGYPGTMGADFVDYLIADQFVIPPEHEEHYTETVIRMPDCFMPRDCTLPRLAAPSRTNCGLPADGFVFCCFNQTYKITPDMFEIWCRLLKAVPDSLLWLPASNVQAEENLKLEAAKRGIASERIFMAAKLPEIQAHLARLQCADLFLDTNPYNAHATCNDALWMGLPVITCVGETFPSRVAGSLLTSIGAPELITYNLEDYFHLALELATDKKKYESVRNKINANRYTSPLFDSKRFTHNLENAYIQMINTATSKLTTSANPHT